MTIDQELRQILDAREAIRGRVVRTPVHRIDGARFGLDGLELVFKLEPLQHAGSFKIRGAFNKLLSLGEEERSRGVVGMSSGNHAQALAYGARELGVPATIVMPDYSVEGKIRATRGYGAEVVVCPTAELKATYERLAKERGLTPVHPFNDEKIIAGAGTAGLELVEDAPDVSCAVVSVGGGGWISGVATAIKGLKPGVRVVGVEPEGAPVVRKSLDAGRMVTLDSVATIADGLAPPFTGDVVFGRIQRYVDDVVTVSDDEIRRALRALMEVGRIWAEPSAAACFAGLLAGKVSVEPGSTVAVMLSGGNISLERLTSVLA